MATDNIQTGDMVQLKSGGPVMTVDWIDDDHKYATCVWFGRDGKQQSHDFYLTSPTKVESTPS